MKQDVSNINQTTNKNLITEKKIQVNGKAIEQEMLTKGSFGEFVKRLNQSLSQEKHVITSILVNGMALSEDEEKNILDKDLSNIGDIEIFTASPVELAHETLTTLDQYIERIIMAVSRSAMHYEQNNIMAGDEYFLKSIDGLDLFIQTIGGIKQALRVGLITKLGLTEAVLIQTMNELLMAKKQNNYIYMAELLKKDLIENLKEWQTVVFPIFRNWKMS